MSALSVPTTTTGVSVMLILALYTIVAIPLHVVTTRRVLLALNLTY